MLRNGQRSFPPHMKIASSGLKQTVWKPPTRMKSFCFVPSNMTQHTVEKMNKTGTEKTLVQALVSALAEQTRQLSDKFLYHSGIHIPIEHLTSAYHNEV